MHKRRAKTAINASQKTTNNKMSISIMKIICIVLSLSLLIGATVDQGEEWKDGPLTEVQDSPIEDDTFSDTYQPLDEPAEYQRNEENRSMHTDLTISLSQGHTNFFF